MGVHVKCPFLQRHNHNVNVNVNAIALFMTRSTLVCFARTAYKAPLLKADLEAVYERNSDLTKLNFLIRLSSTPPLRRSLSTDRQLNWQLRTWLIVRQECTIHSSHPATRPHQRSSILQKRIFTFNYFRPFRSRPLARLSFIKAGPTIPWNSTLRPHQSWN